MMAGDLHGNTAHAIWIMEKAAALGLDRVFQAGDFGAWEHMADGRKFFDDVDQHGQRLGVVMYWLDGNHDKTSLVLESYAGQPDDEGFLICRENVRYSPRGHRWTWSGHKFISLGGAYSVDKGWRLDLERQSTWASEKRAARSSEVAKDWSGSYWFPEEEMTDADMEKILLDDSPVDFMFSHDKPRASSPGWNRKDMPDCWPNQDRLQRAVVALKPKALVHGHLHYRYDDQIRSGDDSWTKVVGLDADPQAASGPVSGSWTLLDLNELPL